MDFSKGKVAAVAVDHSKSGGEELISNLVDLTALPGDMIREELEGIISKAGCEKDSLTLESLREAMLKYLEEVHETL